MASIELPELRRQLEALEADANALLSDYHKALSAISVCRHFIDELEKSEQEETAKEATDDLPNTSQTPGEISGL